MRFYFFAIFSLLTLSSSLLASENQNVNCFQISVFADSTNKLEVTDIKILLKEKPDLFIPAEKIHDSFSPDINYWLYLKQIRQDKGQPYILSFHKWVSSMDLYELPDASSCSHSGRMVPSKQKELSDCNISLNAGSGEFLLKVQNSFHTKVSVNDIIVLTTRDYLKKYRENDFIQGFIQGLFWLMLIYNLLLFFVVKKRMNLFYVAYIFFNSLYLLFVFGYSEQYLFPQNSLLNLFLFTFQPLGMYYYVMFIRLMLLDHCPAYTKKSDRKTLHPYAYFILVLNLFVSISIFYRVDVFIAASRISNVINCVVGIVVVIFYYRRSDYIMHIIMTGSIIMILLGSMSIIYVPVDLYVDNMLYQAGLLIELLLFTYAINRQHQQDVEEHHLAELKNHQIEEELERKNQELISKAIQLSAKDEVIALINGKMNTLRLLEGKDNTAYNKLHVNTSITQSLQKEFELHLNEIYPEFYKALMAKYPDLTPNEIRLCVFLRFNLNTKEIATITQKSAHSIEAMRSRIRQKLHLDRDANLNLILSQLQ